MKRITSMCLSLAVTFLALFTVFPCSVHAAEAVNPEEPCSLTLQYAYGEEVFSDLEISIFRAAEVFEDGTYQLTGDFADYPVNIYGITSRTEWTSIASTLSAYAAADGIEPTQQQRTNENGQVSFESLQPGMYLVLAVKIDTDEAVYTFESFMISLPSFDEDDDPYYQVTANPKCESYEPKPGELEYKVVKQWKDQGHSSDRPSSITVDILKDGAFFSTQTLSAENNWSYRWTALDDGSVWQAVERNVPQEYKVTTVVNGETIVITNARTTGEQNPPQTGGTTVVWPYILAMCAAGAVILIIGISRKRKDQ